MTDEVTTNTRIARIYCKAVMTITNKMYFEKYYERTSWEDLNAMYIATGDLCTPLKVLDLT